MITDSFDNNSEAKINPKFNVDAYQLDICILTFSNVIEDYVLQNYKCEKIGDIKTATDTRIIYKIDYKGKKIGFFKTYVGAPACVGSIETSSSQIKTNKFLIFGGAGCLNKEIAHGKVMVPTEAYRASPAGLPLSTSSPTHGSCILSAFSLVAIRRRRAMPWRRYSGDTAKESR